MRNGAFRHLIYSKSNHSLNSRLNSLFDALRGKLRQNEILSVLYIVQDCSLQNHF